jgi:uncharacterized membrane protein YhhN
MQNSLEASRDARKNPPWPVVAFFLAGVVSAIWVVVLHRWLGTWHRFPNTASTTVCFMMAVACLREVPSGYRWSLVAGLGCSAVGDAFLMSGGRYFLPGLCSFLSAHICYIVGFTRDSRFGEHKLPFACWGLYSLILVLCLWPGVSQGLRIPVLFYTVALSGMAAQAASRAAGLKETPAVFGAVGAGLFVVSDSLLAYQKFREPLAYGHALVLGTYFAAQAGIALSVIQTRCRAR